MEMITAGAEKIVNATGEFKVDDDIDAIIAQGEDRTHELNSRYEGLNFEDLSNFKSESTVQQWEGEDFRPGRKRLVLNPLEPSKRERKTNYSVDAYYKDAIRARPSQKEKMVKIPRHAGLSVLPELQERELAAHKRLNDIIAVPREPQTEEDTPDKLEEERKAEQEFIDNGMCTS